MSIVNEKAEPQFLKFIDISNDSWWTSQTWHLSPDTRCISPWHLLWSLLFSSHTSLLVHNWWGHCGMSLDERRRVSETDLFPAFALRSCQLTQSNPLLTPAPHTHRLSDLGELCLPSEWVPTHHGAVTSHSYPTEFCLWADDAGDIAHCRHKVSSADVLTVSYCRTNKQTLLHIPQITSQYMWPVSFRCLTEQSRYPGYQLR